MSDRRLPLGAAYLLAVAASAVLWAVIYLAAEIARHAL